MPALSLQTLLVLVLTLICAYTDWHKGSVYNILTYPAVIIGLILSFVSAPPEPVWSLSGFAAALTCFGLLWHAGGMGAGDVKLLAAVGALKGLPFILYSSLYIIFIAAMVGIVVLAMRGRLHRTIKWIIFTLLSVFVPGMSPPSLKGEKTYMPFAPFIFLGTTVAVYLEYIDGPFTL